MHMLMHGQNPIPEVLPMSRRSLTTHIDSESQLSEDFDRYVEMHYSNSSSNALQKLVQEGVRPYNNFRKYLNVMGWVAGTLFVFGMLFGLLGIFLENAFWLMVARQSLAFVVIFSSVIIGAGISLMLQMAQFEGKPKRQILKEQITGSDSA
jgi:hypothetical protein